MSKSKEKVYVNRYGRNIVFTQEDDGSVLVTGDFGKFYRVSSHPETGEISCFDPEGGPFISKGVSINHYTGWKDNRVIKTIKIKDGKVTLSF
jgi:hypothetical protein